MSDFSCKAIRPEIEAAIQDQTGSHRSGLTGKFINSIVYVTVATFFIVLLGLMIGFALSKTGFKRLSQIIGGLIGLGYLVSINSVIIPLFLTLSSIKLTDTHVGIMLVYVAFGLPMSVSAQFISLIAPLSIPVAVTVAIINALGIWNEFLLVLVLASSEFTKPLPVGVFSFSSPTSTQLGWQLASLVIAVLPVMVVDFIFNRRIAQGVVAGGVMG